MTNGRVRLAPMSESLVLPERGLYRRILSLALPIMASQFLQTLYNLADTYFLGKLDAASLSAPAVAMPILWFLIVFATGFAMAGTTLIAQSRGKGSHEKQDLYLGQITALVLALSFFLGFLGNILAEPLLGLLNTPDEVAVHASVYMRIVFAGLPFMFLTLVQQAAFQGIGDGVTPLVIQLITVLINLAIDPLFIFGLGPVPAMGVAGAAWATVISRSIAAVVALVLLVRGKRGLKLRLKYMIPRSKEVRLILRIGVPAALGQALTALGFTVLQGVINRFGTATIAAFGIGNRIIGLFNMPAMGMAQATSALVGQSLGARRIDSAKRVARYSRLTILVFLGVSMTLTFFWGNHFTRFFVNDPEVIALGADLFRIVSISVVTFGQFTVLGGVFQGGGDTKPYMILNVTRLWGLRLPLAWLLGVVWGLGPTGVWWAMFASNAVVFIAAWIIYRKGRWSRALNPDDI